jgi:uncharacterized protein (TIGR02598 family)
MRTTGLRTVQARRRDGARAFSLVEIVLAIGVVTFCLLSLLGLISVGLNDNKLVREQVIALNLCRNIESDLRATGPTNSVSPLYGISIPAAGASSSTTLYDSYATGTASFGAMTSASQYRFTITLTGPATGFPNDPVNANIEATWPAQIVPKAPSSASNPTNVVGTVNLDVAINRVGS